jgi:hypothetical protein
MAFLFHSHRSLLKRPLALTSRDSAPIPHPPNQGRAGLPPGTIFIWENTASAPIMTLTRPNRQAESIMQKNNYKSMTKTEFSPLRVNVKPWPPDSNEPVFFKKTLCD